MEPSPYWLLSDQEELRSTGATNVPIKCRGHTTGENKYPASSGNHSLLPGTGCPQTLPKALKWAAHLGSR